MSVEKYQGETLRFYLSENDRFAGKALYDVLIEKAVAAQLSGGTVIRGREGFGAHGEIHTTSVLRLADNLPIVVEFVGRTWKIEAFLEEVESMIPEGLITRTAVEITKLRET